MFQGDPVPPCPPGTELPPAPAWVNLISVLLLLVIVLLVVGVPELRRRRGKQKPFVVEGTKPDRR